VLAEPPYSSNTFLFLPVKRRHRLAARLTPFSWLPPGIQTGYLFASTAAIYQPSVALPIALLSSPLHVVRYLTAASALRRQRRPHSTCGRSIVFTNTSSTFYNKVTQVGISNLIQHDDNSEITHYQGSLSSIASGIF